VVVAYGLILPREILDAPRHGCVNIHASLLPRWRGAAPIQYAIWKGDDKTGVSIMQMEEGLDTGPVISMREIPIAEDTTAPALHDALSALGAEMIVEALDALALQGKLAAVPQDGAASTYAAMLKKEDGIIDWARPAADIDRQIRALNPWPGVWTKTDEGKRIKILSAQVAETLPGSIGDAAPGTVIDALDRSGDIGTTHFHVVIRADADGFNGLLRPNDMFHGDAKFCRKPAMRYEHESNHGECAPRPLISV